MSAPPPKSDTGPRRPPGFGSIITPNPSAPPPAKDKGGRRSRRGGMEELRKKYPLGPPQHALDSLKQGSQSGLTIKTPKQTAQNAYMFGDETPQTLEAQPASRDVSRGIASEGYYPHRKTVGRLNLGSARRKTRRASGNRGDIVIALMEIRDQIKLYHWQTGKFARHKATDDLVASLDTNIDEFVEVYMGKYGRPKSTRSIKLHNFSESAARAFVAKQTDFLTTKMPKMFKSTDSDLLNIRDTILADVNKTLYLFTLQ